MPTGLYRDPDEERAALARSRQSWDKILAARQVVTRADAQAASTMAANYPHMSPGTVIPLAQGGVAPNDPLAQEVALREAKSNKSKRGFMGALGDFVHGVTHLPASAMDLGVGKVLNPAGGLALSALKPMARNTLGGFMFLPELGAGVARDVASAGRAFGAIGGNLAAGAASGAAVGAGVGLIGSGPLAPIGVLAGAAGGAVIGAAGGALAHARGVDVESEGIVNPLSQTTIGQQYFGDKSVGSGFLPGGEAYKAQGEASRRAASIQGHALTPGRMLASSVLEEGTTPYNLISGVMDATVAWKLDPTAAALKARGAAKIRAARFLPSEKELTAAAEVARGADQAVDVAVDAEKLAKQDAGLVDGARKTIIGEKVNGWLGSKKGERAMQWFADNDFETIRKGLGGDKVPVEIVRDLADATTIGEVDAILRPQLGLTKGLEMQPKVGHFGMEVKRTVAGLPIFDKVAESRLWKELPTELVDFNDATKGTHQFELLLADANIGAEDVAKYTRPFAEALLEGSQTSRMQARALMYQALGGAGGDVAKSSPGRAFMNRVARDAARGDEAVMRHLMDEDVLKTPITAVSVGGKTNRLVTASYLSEYIDNGVQVDRTTLRGIRNATSKYGRIMANETIQKPVAFMDHVTNDMWKPSALLRGAWTVRVIGEEQIRMAATGRMSLFNHPISYLAWALDDDGRIAAIGKKFGVNFVGGRGASDVIGESFAKEGSSIIPNADEFERELLEAASAHAEVTNYNKTTEAWQGNGFVDEVHTETYFKGAPGHVEGVAEKIDKAFSDPLMRQLAEQPDNVVREWFMNGEGNEIRQALVKKYGLPMNTRAEVDEVLAKARKELNGTLGRVDEVRRPVPQGALSGSKPMSAEEVANLQGKQVAARPGSPQVREAIATGELNGIPLRDAKGNINRDFVEELRKVEDLPESIVASKARNDTKWNTTRDSIVQHMYTHLMTKPSAKLSRSPMFRQTYWEEARNLMTEMDPAAQSKLIENARKAKLSNTEIKALELRKAAGAGDLTLHEVDMLSKGRALDQTQTLLYDAARRGQISDVLRIVMPFAEAQKEVMGVWAKIGLVDNPSVVRRAQQVLTAARGSGTFYKDPSTGEEMFTFPLSGWATEHIPMIGMNIPLTGRVAGLNTFGTGIIPGMGPAVTITARTLIPDKPQYDDLHKFLDPFGSNAGETEGILEQQFPSWLTSLKRGLSASDSDRTFANAVKDVWSQGVSEGRYRTGTPEEIQEGLDEARSKAKWLYFIKAGASVLGSPTPPSPAFMAMDKDGKWHMAKALSEDYRKMIDDPEIGFDGASAAFLAKYGNNAFAFMQAKTYSTVPSAPSTADYRSWTGTEEGAAAAKYKDIGALFGPQGEGFDYNTYLRNIRSGDTVNLTPDQFQEQTNNRLATMIYYNQADKFGPTPSKEQRAWLADLKDQLREKFPGYGVELPGKPNSETVKNQYIPEIARAVNDPALAGNDVARATKLYLQARDAALESVKAGGGVSFESAKGAAPIRAWLRQILDQLTERVPDFAPMAERIFSREMQDDDEVAQTAVRA